MTFFLMIHSAVSFFEAERISNTLTYPHPRPHVPIREQGAVLKWTNEIRPILKTFAPTEIKQDRLYCGEQVIVSVTY